MTRRKAAAEAQSGKASGGLTPEEQAELDALTAEMEGQ